MPPFPSLYRRLSLFGCLLAGATALLLPGCGGDSAATAESTNPSQPQQQAKVEVAARPCPAKVTALVGSLDRLRRQLSVGLSYEQYAARVKSLRRDYDGVPVDRLGLGCLATTATPAEQALNKYIDATNAWGECLADAACTTATIEPILQRKWRVASGFLSKAQ